MTNHSRRRLPALICLLIAVFGSTVLSGVAAAHGGTAAGHPGRRSSVLRGRAVGDRRRHGQLAVHPVGEYQGRVAASNILGRPSVANYEAVPRVVFSDPQAASVGEMTGESVATVPLSGVARTETYTRAYETRPGFVTLVSDGERLVGAYAVGPEAREWLQQATLAIRARIPLVGAARRYPAVPTFSEALFHALRDLDTQFNRPMSSSAPPGAS